MTTPAGIKHTDGAKLSIFRGYDTSHLVVDETWMKEQSGEIEFPKTAAVPEQNAIPENGRTYHGYNPGSYYLPNDPPEQERLVPGSLSRSSTPNVRLIQEGRLGLAPVRNARNVIDVCTGTGIWATEYATENPDCNVIGSDLSAIQPRESLPNCTFVQHDVEKQDWNYDCKFDYAYFRYVVTCFDDMPSVLRKTHDSMREGGYIELFDTPLQALSLDGSIDGTALEEWGEVGRAAGRKLGRDMAKPRQYKRWLEEAGFVDVVETIIATPVNEWCKDDRQKEIGRFMFYDFYAFVAGLKKLVMVAGYSSEEADDFLVRIRKTLQDPKVHSYYEKYIVYARKPRAGEVSAKPAAKQASYKDGVAVKGKRVPTNFVDKITSSVLAFRETLKNRLGLKAWV